MNHTLSQDRREFFKFSGALVVSASLPWLAASVQAQTATSTKPPLTATELDSWVAIAPDGKVTAFYGKVDLGQSLEIAIGQIVAEELDVAFEQVTIHMGNTATSLNQGGASSALGIQAGAKPLRNAAAQARAILLDMASKQLGLPVQGLSVANGVITSKDDAAKRVSYAELIGGKYFNNQLEWNKQIGNGLEVKGLAKPKAPSEYKVVGKAIARKDVARKVFGSDTFITDIKVPGMLHARVIRTPLAGCTPEKVDASSISSIKGAKVIHEKNFLAVVADKEWDAVQAARLLQVQWSAPKNPPPPLPTPCASCRPSMSGPSSPTPAWARPARLWMPRPTAPRCGQARKSRITRAMVWPSY
jgi:nicotinate dehydrogenase subunit B